MLKVEQLLERNQVKLRSRSRRRMKLQRIFRFLTSWRTWLKNREMHSQRNTMGKAYAKTVVTVTRGFLVTRAISALINADGQQRVLMFILQLRCLAQQERRSWIQWSLLRRNRNQTSRPKQQTPSLLTMRVRCSLQSSTQSCNLYRFKIARTSRITSCGQGIPLQCLLGVVPCESPKITTSLNGWILNKSPTTRVGKRSLRVGNQINSGVLWAGAQQVTSKSTSESKNWLVHIMTYIKNYCIINFSSSLAWVLGLTARSKKVAFTWVNKGIYFLRARHSTPMFTRGGKLWESQNYNFIKLMDIE